MIREIRRTEYTIVNSTDEQGAGGAYHEYEIILQQPKMIKVCQEVSFQNGPIKENGVNGVQIEDLLAICKDRLECFQAGPFSCSENQDALDFIKHAIDILDERTAKRRARGVEGKNEA
jgi:hypothetical protein